MRRVPFLLAALTVVSCSGERLTGVAAQDAARTYQSAAAPATEPLILLDGKAISVAEVRVLDAKTIESVQVVKGRAALQQYGERAANGVVVITTM